MGGDLIPLSHYIHGAYFDAIDKLESEFRVDIERYFGSDASPEDVALAIDELIPHKVDTFSISEDLYLTCTIDSDYIERLRRTYFDGVSSTMRLLSEEYEKSKGVY